MVRERKKDAISWEMGGRNEFVLGSSLCVQARSKNSRGRSLSLFGFFSSTRGSST